MGYERIAKPEGYIYHYTKREHLDSILRDSRIRRFRDSECWFCNSLEETLAMMSYTIMKEGAIYIDVYGIPKRYPPFIPDDYIILKLELRYQNGEWVRWNEEMADDCPTDILEFAKKFSTMKIGFQGDLKFKEHPEIIEVASLLTQNQQSA